MKLFWTILVILYALSPVDFLPEALLGGWGWLDDLIILFVLWNYLRGSGNPLGMFKYGRSQRSGQSADQRGGFDQGRTTADQKDNQYPRDPYTVLGVSRDSSQKEIKIAYRDLAAKYHPDKVQHLGEEFRELAEARFKEIQEAYRQIRKENSKRSDS